MKRLILSAVAVLLLAPVSLAEASSETPQLDRAVKTVKRVAAKGDEKTREGRLAWAIHRYVNRRVRAYRVHLDHPPTSVEDSLRTGSGACGNSTAVALAIARRVGLRVRPAQFFYEQWGQPASHIAWEVWDKGWQLHDAFRKATFRSRSGKLLSARALWKKSSASRRRAVDAAPDRVRDRTVEGPWRYLMEGANLVVGGEGTVDAWHDGGTYPIVASRPNYIGSTVGGDAPGAFDTTIALRYRELHSPYLRLTITSHCASGGVVAQSQVTTSQPVTPTTTTLTLPVVGSEAVLSLNGDCAVVLSEVVNTSRP